MVAMTCGRWGSGPTLPLWEEVLWPFLVAWDSVRLRTACTQWNFPGSMGRMASSSFFWGGSRGSSVSWFGFGPCISAGKVKACALIGLHMMAEENSWRSDSGSSVSSSSSGQNNVGNDALFVIGLQGSGDTIALFLQDWEVAKIALSCHIALDMPCQEMHEVERRRGWFDF